MKQETSNKKLSSGVALLPFLLFIVVFLGSGIVMSALGVDKPFSQFAPLAAIYIAIISAFLIYHGTISEKLNMLLAGICRPNIALVVIIFVLAGGFSEIAEGMGGVDSVVNLCLSIVPHHYIIMGIFLVGCVVSFASGSSLGTATMITPIALGIVEATGVPLGAAIGAVLSGGMFGNQLSPISDCTIASTTGMGVSVKDKSKYNIIVMVPALIVSSVLFMMNTTNDLSNFEIGSYHIVKVLPYVAVLGLAMVGMSVVICLSAGIFAAGIIGIAFGDYTVLTLSQAFANGVIGMGSNILLVMMIGGLSWMVEKTGGINFIVDRLKSIAKSEKSGHLCIAVLSLLVMLCVANDTITVMIVCPLAVEICKEFQVDSRLVSVTIPVIAAAFSPLSPWSGMIFTVQGLVSQAGYEISFFDSFPYTYYPMILTAITVIAIFIPKLSSKIYKEKWDFENNRPIK